MSKLTEIILKAGILSEGSLREMQRWGLPVGDPKPRGEFEAEMTPNVLSQAIANAIEDEGYILTRETDLGAITQYLQTQRPAILHVVMDDGDSNIEVTVGRTPTGEWILPWQSESITDIMTNGETHLRIDKKHIYFNQARELFYGQHKAFIVCTPSTVETTDGNAG